MRKVCSAFMRLRFPVGYSCINFIASPLRGDLPGPWVQPKSSIRRPWEINVSYLHYSIILTGVLSPGQRSVSMDPLIALVNSGSLSNKRAQIQSYP